MDVILPHFFSFLESAKNECCTEIEEKIEAEFGVHVTDTVTEALDIIDTLACDTRMPLEGEVEQTCGYTLVHGVISASLNEVLSNAKPLLQIPSKTAACDAFNGQAFKNGLDVSMLLFPLSPLRECGRGFDKAFSFVRDLYEKAKDIEEVNDLIKKGEESVNNDGAVTVPIKFDDLFEDGKCVQILDVPDLSITDACLHLPTAFSDTCWGPGSSSATAAQPILALLTLAFSFLIL